MAKASEIRAELEKLSDDELREELRIRNLSAAGRRTVILTRLASAIAKEKNQASADTDEQQVGSKSFEENPDVDPLPPLSAMFEEGLQFPEGFIPSAAREEAFNVFAAVDPAKTLPEKLASLDLSTGTIPKPRFSAQMTQPGYFSTISSSPIKAGKNSNTTQKPQAANAVTKSVNINTGLLPSATLSQMNFGTTAPGSWAHLSSVNNFGPPNMNSAGNQPGPNQAVQSNAQRQLDNSFARTIETMRRWNLKFSGTRTEDPENFLTRLNEGRSIVPISNAEFLKCLPFFFEGIALHWFRNEQGNWQSLADFVAAFRARFGPVDYQNALYYEIRNRTQGQSESVSDFMTCIKSLMKGAVPPIPLQQQIEIASRNLLPAIQSGIELWDVQNLTDLELAARRRERRLTVARDFRPPPPASRALHADLAYRGLPEGC